MRVPYKPLRLISAIFLPPILASLFIGILVAPTLLASGARGDGLALLAGLAFFVMIGTAIGIGAMLVFGLGAHAIICRLDKRSSATYALVGAIIGMVASMIFASFLMEGDAGTPRALAVFAICGLPAGIIAAVLFHKIRGPHKPLTPPSNTPT